MEGKSKDTCGIALFTKDKKLVFVLHKGTHNFNDLDKFMDKYKDVDDLEKEEELEVDNQINKFIKHMTYEENITILDSQDKIFKKFSSKGQMYIDKLKCIYDRICEHIESYLQNIRDEAGVFNILKLSLPGGRPIKKEDSLTTAKRELYEEVGICETKYKILDISTYRFFSQNYNNYTYNHIYYFGETEYKSKDIQRMFVRSLVKKKESKEKKKEIKEIEGVVFLSFDRCNSDYGECIMTDHKYSDHYRRIFEIYNDYKDRNKEND